MFEYIIRVIPEGLRERTSEIGGAWAASAFDQQELPVRKKCRNGEPVEWEITAASGDHITIGFYERDIPPWMATVIRVFGNILPYAPPATLEDPRVGLALKLGAAGWRRFTNGVGAPDELGGFLDIKLPTMVTAEDYGWSAPDGQQRLRMTISKKAKPEPPNEEDAGDA